MTPPTTSIATPTITETAHAGTELPPAVICGSFMDCNEFTNTKNNYI